MSAHLPILMVIIPLVVSLTLPLVALRSPLLARSATLGTLGAVGWCAMAAMSRVLHQGNWHYELGGWAPPWGIEYVVDPLSAGMVLLITAIACLVAIYASPHLHGSTSGRIGLFYSLFLLLYTGLTGIILTGDLFNLYVFLEISSLAGYALLSSGQIRSAVATYRYLLVGTIAATFYLLGIGFLYSLTGTLNMADMAARLPATDNPAVFITAVGFIVLGLSIKAALFPMHGWLPDAYTYAPAPIIGFVSGVMAKVSAYALFRLLYFVLRPEGAVLPMMSVLGWTAALGIVAGSVLAMAQNDMRRMLAYSSVSQMGYIVLGLSIATPAAITGALLHVLNHAIMKACLFFVAGGVQWRTGHYKISDFVGLSRRMPWTAAALVVVAFSMIGLPPTAGFFSKWYLVTGAISAHAWVFVGALVISSLLNAVYFFRVIEISFLRQPQPLADAPAPVVPGRQELPAAMLMPILVLATAVILLGFLNHAIVTHVIQPVMLMKGL
jgi:multicomponent Na+:H+ antiporter subunit D